MSADNSALAVSKLNDASYKIAAKKVRAANVNRAGQLDLESSSSEMSGRTVTTKPVQGEEHNEHPRSVKDDSLQNSDADDEENNSPDTRKALKAAARDTVDDY